MASFFFPFFVALSLSLFFPSTLSSLALSSALALPTCFPARTLRMTSDPSATEPKLDEFVADAAKDEEDDDDDLDSLGEERRRRSIKTSFHQKVPIMLSLSFASSSPRSLTFPLPFPQFNSDKRTFRRRHGRV